MSATRAQTTAQEEKLYDGHFHDLLNDIGKEKVMSDIKQWINAHISAN